jgi:prepilin-type N-terminal cleavage/methylation domain-containing protein
MKRRGTRRQRPGFTLIEALLAAALLGVCAMGVTSTWSFCYTMNDQARRMQAGRDVLEQEMERVRRLNWTGLGEQSAWAARCYYDGGGNPLGAPGSAQPVTGGFVSYIKVETMSASALSVAQAPTVDSTGGSSRSLRRVTICVQPTGASVSASPPTAQAVTYLTLGGP